MSALLSSRAVRAVGAVLVLVLLFLLGPRKRFEPRWIEPDLSENLDAWVAAREADVPGIREGGAKGIVWADPARKEPTPFSIVYLHGFSADRHEIEPVVTEVAARVGANAFFTRLQGHGRDGAAMGEATVEGWLDDSVEALAVGERIGERVILVGTSTGGTLATWIAARPEAAGRLAGLVLISPNYQPADPASRIFLVPWGSLVARLVVGPERCFEPHNEAQARHWTTCYPTSAIATMMALVEHVRTMDLSRIRVRTLVLFSPGDRIVDETVTERVVAGMTGAETTLYVVHSSSDPYRHVIAGDIISPDSNDEVVGILEDFLRRIGGVAAGDGEG